MTKNEGTNEEETEQKYTKFKTSHNAWTLFKIAVIGAQPKYFSESKETLAKSRKRPTWLSSNVQKAKKGYFMKWKAFLNENKMKHELCQIKYRVIIWNIEKEFKEYK